MRWQYVAEHTRGSIALSANKHMLFLTWMIHVESIWTVAKHPLPRSHHPLVCFCANNKSHPVRTVYALIITCRITDPEEHVL